MSPFFKPPFSHLLQTVECLIFELFLFQINPLGTLVTWDFVFFRCFQSFIFETKTKFGTTGWRKLSGIILENHITIKYMVNIILYRPIKRIKCWSIRFSFTITQILALTWSYPWISKTIILFWVWFLFWGKKLFEISFQLLVLP